MAADEASRHEPYNRLTEVLGQPSTDTMMQYLPPTGWDGVATTRDLDLLRAELHTDMAGLRTELHGSMHELRDELRGEMGELRDELRGEMSELRGEFTELRTEFHGLRSEFDGLRVEVADRLRQQTYAMLGAMVTLTGTTAAAATMF